MEYADVPDGLSRSSSPSVYFHHWTPPQSQTISIPPISTSKPTPSRRTSSPGSNVRPTGVPSYRRSFDSPPSYLDETKDTRNTVPEKPYCYQSLPSANDIRILKILPGEPGQEIVCELIVTILMPQSSQPDIQYAALSYCWGPDEACSEIRIRSQQSNTTPDNFFHFSWSEEGTTKINVKSNLYAALQQFRETEQEVYLWVDALCINQEDKNEKAHQISKMQEIYNNATNVCIWLGPTTLISEVALPFVKEVLNLEQFDALIKDGSNRHKWHALANMMRNRWFSRRWVIQELTLARNATIHCGATAVHWNDFTDAVALFVTKLDKIKELFPQSRPHGTGSDTLDDIRVLGANALVHASNYLFRKSPDGEILERIRTMETLMSTLLPFEATDPKDTIYAVLSLAKDEPGHKIIPDYSKDLAEVCTDFIKSCVESSGSLKIICRHWAPIKKDFSHPKYSNFPSWIPCISGSAFGAPEDALNGRANGDSFVGDPGRCNYNASLGIPPSSVRFGSREDNHARDPRSATLRQLKDKSSTVPCTLRGLHSTQSLRLHLAPPSA
jgi:hypothetical protein